MTDPAWLRALRPGSFRGVPFQTLEATTEGGRRGLDAEHAYREDGSTTDSGRKLRRWSMSLFVIGSDYHTQLRALTDALDAPGAAELVHPFEGAQRARCRLWTSVQGQKTGGMAEISAEFVEEGSAAVIQAESAAAVAATAADAADAAAAQQFAVSFSATAPGPNVAGRALTACRQQLLALSTDVVGPAVRQTAEIAQAVALLGAVGDDLVTLVGAPGDLAARLQAAAAAVQQLQPLRYAIARRRPRQLTTAAAPGERQIVANANAIARLTSQAAITAFVRLATVAAYPTADQVAEDAAAVDDAIDAERVASTEYGTIKALSDLRVATAQAMREQARTSPQLRDWSTRAVTSTVEIAWRLYRDPTRAPEILQFNPEIEHPAFIPPGVYRVKAV